MKPQAVRALDVILIGPVMALGAVALSKDGKSGLGAVLGGMAAGTILYNAANYAEVRRRQRRIIRRLPEDL